MKKSYFKKTAIVMSLLIAMLALSGCGRKMHRMMHHMGGEHFGRMHEFGNDMIPFGFGDHGGHGGQEGRDEMVGVSHIFEATEDGAVYQLIAEDVDDAETIAMIQERLARMADDMGAHDADTEDADEEDSADSDAADSDESDSDNAKATDGDHENGGDYRDQGRGMRRGPGLFGRGMADLMDDVTVAYSDLDDGGQLTISSENPAVVEMIHAWVEDGPMGERRAGRGRQ